LVNHSISCQYFLPFLLRSNPHKTKVGELLIYLAKMSFTCRCTCTSCLVSRPLIPTHIMQSLSFFIDMLLWQLRRTSKLLNRENQVKCRCKCRQRQHIGTKIMAFLYSFYMGLRILVRVAKSFYDKDLKGEGE